MDNAPKPRTLQLFRKKYPTWVIVLGIVGVVLAVVFMACMIRDASRPPELYQQPSEAR